MTLGKSYSSRRRDLLSRWDSTRIHLSNVMFALGGKKEKHIPFRNSKLIIQVC